MRVRGNRLVGLGLAVFLGLGCTTQVQAADSFFDVFVEIDLPGYAPPYSPGPSGYGGVASPPDGPMPQTQGMDFRGKGAQAFPGQEMDDWWDWDLDFWLEDLID